MTNVDGTPIQAVHSRLGWIIGFTELKYKSNICHIFGKEFEISNMVITALENNSIVSEFTKTNKYQKKNL